MNERSLSALAVYFLLTMIACLAEKQQYEVHRQERQFELCERRHQYQWAHASKSASVLPAQIAGNTIKDLPEMERLRATKFTGLRWDIDPAIIEYFRYLLYDIVDGSRRQHLEPVEVRTAGGKLFDRQKSLKVRTTESDREARRRTMLRQYSVQVAARVTAPDKVTPKHAPATAQETTSPSRSKAKARWMLVSIITKYC